MVLSSARQVFQAPQQDMVSPRLRSRKVQLGCFIIRDGNAVIPGEYEKSPKHLKDSLGLCIVPRKPPLPDLYVLLVATRDNVLLFSSEAIQENVMSVTCKLT